jgi:hypothetical protein
VSDSTQLERRYRRLLAFYPNAFRREHEQEMLAVLIAGAAEGQRRPSLDEAIDLVSNAILMRLWQTCTKLFVRSSYEYRHRHLLWSVRFVASLVLFSIGMFVLAYGSWWALPFLAAAAARFFVGYRIYQATQNQPPDVTNQRI